jgi:hypothetical protein
VAEGLAPVWLANMSALTSYVIVLAWACTANPKTTVIINTHFVFITQSPLQQKGTKW